MLQMPSTETEWKNVANEFEEKLNFNHCLGAMDGKHIAITKPPHSGSLYYNYKGFFSVVLFAVVNSKYEFMYVHTGTNGNVADAAMLESTKFYKQLIDGNSICPKTAHCLVPKQVLFTHFLGTALLL